MVNLSKIVETKKKWLFPDDLKNRTIGTFVRYSTEKSKYGEKEIPVFVLKTEWSEETLISVWKVIYTDVIDNYGSETEEWAGKLVGIESIKGKIVLTAEEESI